MGKRRQECPSGKTCYPTRGAAETARQRLGHGRAYRCGCGAYHTTSHTKVSYGRHRNRAARR